MEDILQTALANAFSWNKYTLLHMTKVWHKGPIDTSDGY